MPELRSHSYTLTVDELIGAPDHGVNTEAYTAGTFIELETLGPIATLEPGSSADHEAAVLEQMPGGRAVRWSLDVDPIDLF